MANEAHIDYESGNTVYFVRRNAAGQVALSDGSAWETWGASGHDADDYDVSLTDKGGDRYVGDFDAGGNISAGRYTIQGFLQLGANPADGDDFIGGPEEDFVWTGTAELELDDIPTAAEIVTAIKAMTGITAGGNYTLVDLLKALGAYQLGKWIDKSGEGGTIQELLDWEDKTTVILELMASDTTPYKTVTKQ
jgi:hypothetical protein